MYFTWVWLVGLAFVILGGILNLVGLPYVDLVLLSTTVGLSMIFSNLLAVKFLGEKLVWKYDLPAFILICIGFMAIVLISKTEEQELTPDRVIELLTAVRTIIYLSFTIGLMVASLVALKFLVKSTKIFEKDIHEWLKVQIE